MSLLQSKSRMLIQINWICKSAACCAAGIAICLFGLTLLVITPTYDTNDDPYMGLVASGYGTVEGPDEHLMYSNVILGFILKQLYTVAPLIPWYGSYLLLTQFVAHWLLLYTILLLKRNFLAVFSYLIFYMGIGIYFLAHLQFTSTAFLIGLAGLSLILVSLIRDSRHTHLPWLKWEGSCCLIYASLIRFGSLQMLVLSSLPLLLMMCWQLYRTVNYKPYLLPAALAMCGVLGAHYYDREYYLQDEAWHDFMPYYSAIGALVDTTHIPYIEQTKPIFNEVGWSSFDYMMLREWIYLDLDKFSLSRMLQFKEKTDELKLRTFPQIRSIWIQTGTHVIGQPVVLITLFATILFNCLNQKSTWQRSIIRWLLIWVGLIMIMLLTYLKLPARVFICLIALPLYFTLLLNQTDLNLPEETRTRSTSGLFKTGLVILILGSFLLAWGQKIWSDKSVAKNTGFKQNLTEMIQMGPDKVFIATWVFPIESFLSYDNQSEIKDLKFLFLNGLQHSPHFHNKMQAYQIQSPLVELIETDRLFLIAPEQWAPVLSSYLKEYYGGNVLLRPKYQGEGFLVYQLTPVKTKPSLKKPDLQSESAPPNL